MCKKKKRGKARVSGRERLVTFSMVELNTSFAAFLEAMTCPTPNTTAVRYLQMSAPASERRSVPCAEWEREVGKSGTKESDDA